MKLYIVSGLGADRKVLDKLVYNENIEAIHIPWLIPEKGEDFHHYVHRMAENIEIDEEYYLMGYSFGGLVVQEIQKLKPAKKVVILGSIRSHQEQSGLMKLGNTTNLLRYLPLVFFNHKNPIFTFFFKRLFPQYSASLFDYFCVTDPYYIKWSLDCICHWKFEKLESVIQIMGDKDIVFPIKNSKPDYVIKNGTHMFPLTKHQEVSKILKTIFV